MEDAPPDTAGHTFPKPSGRLACPLQIVLCESGFLFSICPLPDTVNSEERAHLSVYDIKCQCHLYQEQGITRKKKKTKHIRSSSLLISNLPYDLQNSDFQIAPECVSKKQATVGAKISFFFFFKGFIELTVHVLHLTVVSEVVLDRNLPSSTC